MNLREGLKEARQLGCSIRIKRGTGEVRVRHPGYKTLNLNSRRKDAPRALTMLLRRLRS